jgi:hypothetical protein
MYMVDMKELEKYITESIAKNFCLLLPSFMGGPNVTA